MLPSSCTVLLSYVILNHICGLFSCVRLHGAILEVLRAVDARPALPALPKDPFPSIPQTSSFYLRSSLLWRHWAHYHLSRLFAQAQSRTPLASQQLSSKPEGGNKQEITMSRRRESGAGAHDDSMLMIPPPGFKFIPRYETVCSAALNKQPCPPITALARLHGCPHQSAGRS